ncbi:class I SAM-dependent methyltransferase [Candidatus Woesearchaeota archaeon]|nr:class I SAM-dependent methyltransferase [Candidatus Woesearchaeota archaeon]
MKQTQNVMEEVNCDLCNANDYKIIYPSQYHKMSQQELAEKFRSSGDELLLDQMVQCNHCSLKYVNPRIKSELIIKGYSEGTDENFISQAESREKTFDQQLQYIEKIIHKNNSNQKGKIYDIGTAGGSFLQTAKKRGWEVYGTEPNKWLCEWGKKNYNINIQPGNLFANKFETNFFDVVTMWDVLEHVPSPTKNLQEINRLLKPKGYLIINYPDIGSWLSRAMRRKWIFLLSVHLYYFDRKTIKKMLEKNGFEIIKIKPHFQTLQLGYLTFRMKAYSNILHKISSPVVKTLKLNNLQIPYWLGQTLVIAKKK